MQINFLPQTLVTKRMGRQTKIFHHPLRNIRRSSVAGLVTAVFHPLLTLKLFNVCGGFVHH